MNRLSNCIAFVMAVIMLYQPACIADGKVPDPNDEQAEVETNQRIQRVTFSSPDSGAMHHAELLGTTIGGIKRGQRLVIDGQAVDRNRYYTSRIMLGDVTDNGLDEVFFYQYSTGSAGAMGLNVFGLIDHRWQRIFTDPSLGFDVNEDDRFRIQYPGHKRLRFYDQHTQLSGVLDLSAFQLTEAQLSSMRFLTDPISEYAIHNENVGCGIETTQYIFAFSHPRVVATVHQYFRYQFAKHAFSLYETRIYDHVGELVARSQIG